MDVHKNAPLTPKGREAMVRCVIDGGLSKAAAARQFNTTPKTVTKWVERYRAETSAARPKPNALRCTTFTVVQPGRSGNALESRLTTVDQLPSHQYDGPAPL
jgi:transposase-like protein